MINNLKDFKNTTKRIQQILQTFEIKTPEAFRLSNSASLNFMARILGYNNYNTIKNVLENQISKEKKMKIIELDTHEFILAEQIITFQKHDWGNKEWDVVMVMPLNYPSPDAPELRYKFTTKYIRDEVYNQIKEFCTNEESSLNLSNIIKELENKSKNKDNRANQLNPNNTST